MDFDFLNRLSQELRVTSTAAEETILAIAERVNRKVQLLRLHWRASQLHTMLAKVHHDLGQQVAEVITSQRDSPEGSGPRPLARTHPDLEPLANRAREQSRILKAQLDGISTRIVSMQSEALREDLLHYTRELELRGFTLQYVQVARGSRLTGQAYREVDEAGVRVVSILRGPLLMPVEPDEPIHANDGILLLGPPESLAACAQRLSPPPITTSPPLHEEDLIGRASHA